MNRRREAMRIAGWLAVTVGLVSMTAAMATDSVAADLAGGYGLLFVLAGGWVLIGLSALNWRERAAARRVEGTVPQQASVLDR